MQTANARDGMSGNLQYQVVIEIAKVNGIEGELLLDFMDFVATIESEIATKRKESSKSS